MKTFRNGFTLVEVMVVVLILSILASIAAPLYVNTRKASAARSCHSNLAIIAAAESSYATRFGKYVGAAIADTSWSEPYTSAATPGGPPSGGLIGAPEGLARAPVCPLDDAIGYMVVVSADGNCTISCPGKREHEADTGAAASQWEKVLHKPGSDGGASL